MKYEIKKSLPTLDELLGLDRFDLTYSQRCDCITLYNHLGQDAAIEQATKFEFENVINKLEAI